MQTSGFFNSEILPDGSYDRTYLAEQFAHYFAQFVSNGVYATPATQLQVVQSSTQNMNILVHPGNGFINGYWYKNDADYSIPIEAASGTKSRYDAIVLRYSLSDRNITLAIKKGAENTTNPVKPSLERNADVYELCLAYVYIVAGAVGITNAEITDTRSNSDLCGFVAGLIQQINTKDLFLQYDTAFNTWWDNIKEEIGDDTENFTFLFNTWFDTIKGKLEGEPATALTMRLDDVEKRMYGFENKSTVFNSDGSILERFGDGKYQTTIFEQDGSITQRMFDAEDGIMYKKITAFNADGSITETVS